MKGYSAFLKVSALVKPHNQFFGVISRAPVGGGSYSSAEKQTVFYIPCHLDQWCVGCGISISITVGFHSVIGFLFFSIYRLGYYFRILLTCFPIFLSIYFKNFSVRKLTFLYYRPSCYLKSCAFFPVIYRSFSIPSLRRVVPKITMTCKLVVFPCSFSALVSLI